MTFVPTSPTRTHMLDCSFAPLLPLREARPSYNAGGRPRLLEADLFRLWEGQRFPKTALVTADGQPLRVIFRGRPGLGPGPDFRGAMIAAPGGLLSGDVELHVRTSDFRRHGHHLDPAYADVALHVVFFHDEAGHTALPGGGSAPVLALGGLRRLADWLDRPARWSEPCRDAAERMTPAGLGAALDRLGAMRFRQKTAAWRKRLLAGELPEDALWSGLLEALAYGGERVAFRALAGVLPWNVLRAALPGTADCADGAQIYADGLIESRALSLLGDTYASLKIEARRTRPGNGAEKRLAGAAALAARFAGPGLAASLIGPLAEPEDAPREIIAALAVPKLVGRARAIEIAGNVVLPLAAALCDEPAASQIEAIFAHLPLPARYGAVRHLHAVADGALPVGMRRQQGMLYLLHQYCTQGGCGKCPLS